MQYFNIWGGFMPPINYARGNPNLVGRINWRAGFGTSDPGEPMVGSRCQATL